MHIKFRSPNKTFSECVREIYLDFCATHQPTGNWKLYLKAAFFVIAWLALYVSIAFNLIEGWMVTRLILLAICTAGIGFNVMHDGGHGSFSRNKTVNLAAANSLNVLGGSANLWNIKHNIIHHTFTNIHEHDDDLDLGPFARMHLSQKWRLIYVLQPFYIVILYSLGYLVWVFVLDFIKYFRGHVSNRGFKFTSREHVIFWASKAFYLGLAFGLPSQSYGFGDVMLGYLLFAGATGLLISVTFQLAHAVENVRMYDNPADGIIENDQKAHQVMTTANFATKNPLVTFFTGGLNHQVEHHLFPKVSHIHYPKLREKVKQACRKHGLTYHENSLLGALWSHIKYVTKLGWKMA